MDRNISIINHILEHMENIFNAQKRFGNNYHSFITDKDYFNSICMSILQIGELAHHLTSDFRSKHTDIPWKSIIGLRNIVVHG